MTDTPKECPKCGAGRQGLPFRAKDYEAIYWMCNSKTVNGEFHQDADCRIRELEDAALASAAQIAELQAENQRLRSMCGQQQTAIEDLSGMADAVERLREIGNTVGCDHVDGPDGRSQLVNCVEQVIADVEGKNWRLCSQLFRAVTGGDIDTKECDTLLAEYAKAQGY